DWWEFESGRALLKSDLEQIAHGVFPGYNPTISESYCEWFEAERAEACLLLRRVVGTQLAELRRGGRWDLVDLASRALLALDPLSEEGTLAKAEALAISGSKRAALAVIDSY